MKKIMFNDKYGLTKAVLVGRKTMMRRIVPEGTPFGNWEETLKKSRYQVGEVVAVAQNYEDVGNVKYFPGEGKWHCMKVAGWDNKMFVRAALMPHQIRITNIRIEKLQDISDEDCFREGVDVAFQNGHAVSYYRFENSRGHYFTPREAFAALIDKVSGKGTWERNSYVFVYEFELIK